jgi:hypothetical protein
MSDIYSSEEIYHVARALAWVAAPDTPPQVMAMALAMAFGGGSTPAGVYVETPREETPNQRLMREMRECRRRLTGGT